MKYWLKQNLSKKMKKIFLPLLAVFYFSHLQAQIYTEDGRYELIGKDDQSLINASGSPYLTEEFLPGKIYFEGKPPLSVHLRYNIYNETIEVKPDPNKDDIFKVSDKERAIYELNGDKLVSREFWHNDRKIWGFFLEHYNGDQYQLLEKPEIKVTPPVRSESGYSEDESAKMKKTSSFYILDKNGEIVNVRIKHRDIKKAFSSPASKKYLSDNKIREAEDLVAFLQYMDGEQQ